jgi:hypothetical protein
MLDNSLFSEPSDGAPGTLDRKIALKTRAQPCESSEGPSLLESHLVIY